MGTTYARTKSTIVSSIQVLTANAVHEHALPIIMQIQYIPFYTIKNTYKETFSNPASNGPRNLARLQRRQE